MQKFVFFVFVARHAGRETWDVGRTISVCPERLARPRTPIAIGLGGSLDRWVNERHSCGMSFPRLPGSFDGVVLATSSVCRSWLSF